MQKTDFLTSKEALPLTPYRTVRSIQRAFALKQIPPGVGLRIGRNLYFSRSRLLDWIANGANAAPNDMHDESAAA